MTELVVGTKKGLFVLEGDPGAEFDVKIRAFAGEPVEDAMRDELTGRLFAGMVSPFYGPKLCYSDDVGGECTQPEGLELREGGPPRLVRIWVLVPGERDQQL